MLAQRIKQQRLALGYSQADLGQRAGTSQKQIWKYENGDQDPSSQMLLAIANALNVSTDYLLGRLDNPERPARNLYDLSPRERSIITALRNHDTNAALRAIALPEYQPDGEND
jgi:transcriptional regulator with XRE-family HTH domain